MVVDVRVKKRREWAVGGLGRPALADPDVLAVLHAQVFERLLQPHLHYASVLSEVGEVRLQRLVEAEAVLRRRRLVAA